MDIQLGKIWVAAVDENEAFDPVTHARQDFDVANVTLDKNDENSFWSAKLMIRNPGGGIFRPGQKKRVHISEEVDGVVRHRLTGYLEGWPIGKAGALVEVSVVAKPKNAEQAEIAALAGVNDDPWALFTDPGSVRKAETVLAARHAALNWGRDGGLPTLVDLVGGSGFLDIDQRWIAGTLTLDQPSAPIARVDVVLKASWTQSYLKYANVGPQINGGNFGTINPPDWGKFPKVGEKVGDWVVIRERHELMSSGSANAYSEIYDASYKTNKPKSIDPDAEAQSTIGLKFKRYFYELDLVCAAVLTARRTETIRFSVAWGGQSLNGYEGTVEELELTVNNLDRSELVAEWQQFSAYNPGMRVRADGVLWECTRSHQAGQNIWQDFGAWMPVMIDGTALGGSAATQFFGAPSVISYPTPDGGQIFRVRNPNPGLTAINYAFNQARAKILNSYRVVRAKFDVPWEFVSDLQGCEVVRVADPDIPGGQIYGKVVSINADLGRGVASISIAAIPGLGVAHLVPGKPAYFNPILDTQGLLNAGVVNDYEEQEATLALMQYDASPSSSQISAARQSLFERVQAIKPQSPTQDISAIVDFVSQDKSDPKKRGPNLDKVVSKMPSSLNFTLSGVPKGGDLEVNLNMGTYYVDSAMQIVLE